MSVGPGPSRLGFTRGGGGGGESPSMADTGYLPCYLLGSNSSNNVKMVNDFYIVYTWIYGIIGNFGGGKL